MKSKASFWPIIGSLLVLSILVYLFSILITSITKYVQLISPNIAAAIIAGLVTVAGYFISRNFERRKIIEQQIREKKLPVYEDFIDFLFKVLMNSKSNEPISNEEIEKFVTDFSKKSIVWLSDKSLKSYINWKQVIGSGSDHETTKKALFALEDLFLEIRKDIGHSNKELKRGDLLSLFVTDIHNYLE